MAWAAVPVIGTHGPCATQGRDLQVRRLTWGHARPVRAGAAAKAAGRSRGESPITLATRRAALEPAAPASAGRSLRTAGSRARSPDRCPGDGKIWHPRFWTRVPGPGPAGPVPRIRVARPNPLTTPASGRMRRTAKDQAQKHPESRHMKGLGM